MELLPDFLAFYNIGQCTTGASSNCSPVCHLICFCGYSQSNNFFLLSLRKFCIHLNWHFYLLAIRDHDMSLLGDAIMDFVLSSWGASSFSWTTLTCTSTFYHLSTSILVVWTHCSVSVLQFLCPRVFIKIWLYHMSVMIRDSVYILETCVTFIDF